MSKNIHDIIHEGQSTEKIKESDTDEKLASSCSKIIRQTKLWCAPKTMGRLVQNKIDRCLVELITRDYQPISIVEDKGFRNFVNTLNPSYQIPTRKTVSNTLLPEIYEKRVNKVQSIVKNAKSVTLTTDCWTSVNTILLECSCFPEAHTSVNLATELNKIVVTWGLENRILLAVTDNAANITKAIKDLKWRHFGCYARTINLIAEDAIIIVEPLIKKVRTLVAHFKRSTSAATKLVDIQKQYSKTPKKLLQDVRTRWNSTFYMVERILELEEVIRTVLALLDKENLPIIFVEEWQLLKDAKKVLEPLECITKMVSGESYMVLSSIIVLTNGLENMISELKKEELFEQALTMVNRMLHSLKSRLGDLESSRTLTISTFLDPRFKNIAFSSDCILERTKKEVINLVANKIQKQEAGTRNNPEKTENYFPSTSTDESTRAKSCLSIWTNFDQKAATV
ncbi:unnamed protein product [Psylliodes chrysocephalus]|uniref:Zinc finger BED domain-containing protein 4 n=1 Tax=Psylliodes chrysocephalus TaxID=3402493 RepID=A0A9P0CTL8_9CUCU|nr:unnamed protein product [Psylliodes chrysocephala]